MGSLGTLPAPEPRRSQPACLGSAPIFTQRGRLAPALQPLLQVASSFVVLVSDTSTDTLSPSTLIFICRLLWTSRFVCTPSLPASGRGAGKSASAFSTIPRGGRRRGQGGVEGLSAWPCRPAGASAEKVPAQQASLPEFEKKNKWSMELQNLRTKLFK